MTRILFTRADLDRPERDVARRIGPAGSPWDIAVINGTARRFWSRSSGAFSLKWMAEGRARYGLECRAHTVSKSVAILVDQDQPYEMEFEGRPSSQSFCLFFARPLVAEAWASVEGGFAADIDPTTPRAFPNVPFAPSPQLGKRLEALCAGGPDADADEMEATLLLALGDAVGAALRHRRLIQRLPAAKASTRAHVLGLLERARARIVAADGVGVGLDALAIEAGLSKFHFLRLFKAVYASTPLAFAEQRRMSLAAKRLAGGVSPVIEIAADLGYESPSAFARAFHRHAGVAPAAFRAAAN
jgi:AraC-like DNA-binding protein